MAKVNPYHTDLPEYPPEHRNVYHDHDDCKNGKAIKSWHRKGGPGGKQRCNECIGLGYYTYSRKVISAYVRARLFVCVEHVGRFKAKSWLLGFGWVGTVLMAIAVIALVWSISLVSTVSN